MSPRPGTQEVPRASVPPEAPAGLRASDFETATEVYDASGARVTPQWSPTELDGSSDGEQEVSVGGYHTHSNPPGRGAPEDTSMTSEGEPSFHEDAPGRITPPRVMQARAMSTGAGSGAGPGAPTPPAAPHHILSDGTPLPFPLFPKSQFIKAQNDDVKQYLYGQMCKILSRHSLGGRGIKPVLVWSAAKSALRLDKLYAVARPDSPWMLLAMRESKGVIALLCTAGLRLNSEYKVDEVLYVNMNEGKQDTLRNSPITVTPSKIEIGTAGQVQIANDFKSVTIGLNNGIQGEKLTRVEYWVFEWP